MMMSNVTWKNIKKKQEKMDYGIKEFSGSWTEEHILN